MVERLSFEDQIRTNKIKSVFLMGFIFCIFLVLGYIFSIIYDPGAFFIIMILSIIISMLYLIISYYNSDKIALASVNAKKASPTEHRMLYHAVDSMAIASGLPKPRIFVMESNQINAFASGRDPQHAVICVTTGLLNKLNKQQLEGVIAHEMAHIANFDIRFMTLTAVMVGMISIASEIFLRSLWFSGGDNRDKGGAIFIILGIILAILAPILAHLVSLAISRKREFTADATGVKFTRYPTGLASALKAIKNEQAPTSQDKHHYAKAMAPLFISNPFKSNISGLFATHPPIDERIKRLEAM
ncbi:zinc metalloprotease HtpX [Candidatus Pacearchaeota archaeon CG10_big_fil_rev_8_21_14_0_10_31_24]|nr:MAG: zinc metalloprotease HtpX [Candidatus Pacearchaeota archaeon CG10_big_fil_rev_8_21_14_0_10_31_24]